MSSSFKFGPEAERRYHLLSGGQFINVVPLEESFESIRQHILSVEQANEGLRDALETLRDEKWKDKELQHWKEVADNALDELHRGFGIDQEEADAIIVNTCYVKLPTESKVINRIKKLQNEFPDKEIIVAGCMVEVDPKKLDAIGPNCSWIGPHQLNKTADVVKSAIGGEVSREFGFSDEPKVCVPKIRQDPCIHVIQICEGCLGSCTYCCTRFARGHLNSYPIKDIVEEARQAIEDGCVEIQLNILSCLSFCLVHSNHSNCYESHCHKSCCDLFDHFFHLILSPF